MIERYVDSKIWVLKKILKDNSVSNNNSPLSAERLSCVINDLVADNLINVKDRRFIPFFGPDNEEFYDENYIFFTIEIKDKKTITRLLHKLEKKISQKKETVTQNKIIEIISKDIGDEFDYPKIIDLMDDCLVDKELIWEAINSFNSGPFLDSETKKLAVFEVLRYLIMSENKDDSYSLCKIIENFCHPLYHDGDRNKADRYRDKFNNILEYDGYVIINNKLVQLNDDIRKKLKKEKISYAKQQDTYKEIKQQALQIEITKIPKIELNDLANQKKINNINKTDLLGQNILFDDEKVQILIGNKNCQLPPYRNEHYFCRAIFQHPINEFVDWSIIYENMDKVPEGINKTESRKEKRAVQDTVYLLNKRIKKVINTEDNLFTWKEKSIKRNY